MNNKKEVLLIFKTHLDLGYTDLAANVKEKYMNAYIPNAIKVGRELQGTETPFIWTTGSWLIQEALKCDFDGSVEAAVRDGIICWHGLPFTTHTELMNTKLFEYGLSVSQKLDRKFGKKTIAAKMTDVPGHTIGMVPYMKNAGIEFLHIGVNPATPLPPVPPLFKWRCGEDEITVMYQQSYGSSMDMGDFVVYFAHTNDNNGPQTAEEIVELYDKVKSEFPNCKITAATLDDVALKLRERDDIPVFDREIGDTWIHGAATDPKKLGMYRELLRYTEDIDSVDEEAYDSLLLVPEHTWGLCLQKYFDDTAAWYIDDFKKTEGTEKRAFFESSWSEQREYVSRAVEKLGYEFEYNTDEPDLSEWKKAELREADFELSWQLFDLDDYTEYIRQYSVITARNIDWMQWDFIKLGMPDIKGGIYTAECTECYEKSESLLFKLEFEKDLTKEYGLPYFWAERSADGLNILMVGKQAVRFPQAFWLKFKKLEEAWRVHKLGQWIKPDDIAGSPLITAVDTGIRNSETEILSLDAALVAPYGRNLLRYGIETPKQDMYFNLYNNIWNTNFPMWYSDDTLYRFKIKKTGETDK